MDNLAERAEGLARPLRPEADGLGAAVASLSREDDALVAPSAGRTGAGG